MIWFLAKDSIYYQEDGKNLIKKSIVKLGLQVNDNMLENMLQIFSKEDASKMLKSGYLNKHVISPVAPDELEGFFTIVELPNAKGIITETQYELGITAQQVLKEEIGMNVSKSSYKFSDMAGAEKLKEYIERLLIAKSAGEKVKGILLTGVAGTGKSFAAKCLAGETDRLLVELNFATLSYSKNPVKEFLRIVDFLVSQGQKYIIWIDEIEKMFDINSSTSQHLLNVFLTFQNEIGNTINLDAIVVATANDITKIIDHHPETVRSGRFDLRLFLNFPRRDTAKKVFTLYIERYNENLDTRYYALLKSYMLNSIDDDNPFLPYLKYKDNIKISTNIFKLLKKLSLPVFSKKFNNKFFGLCSFNIELPEDFSTRFRLDFDLDFLIGFIDNYDFNVSRSDKVNKNFPYVHAEIEQLTSQIFLHNAYDKLDSKEKLVKIIDKLLKDNVPLGESTKEPIQKMLAQKKFFLEIS